MHVFRNSYECIFDLTSDWLIIIFAFDFISKLFSLTKPFLFQSHIGGALVPSAIFAAVPKTPPPTTPPGTGVGLAASLTNVATIGRLFAEPVPLSEDDLLSDPDSSLYDYQQMEEAG